MTRRAEGRRPCTFRVRCDDAEHVFLVGTFSETGRPIVVPLDPAGEREWTKTIPVRPGVYRFRLYVDDGRLLTWLCTSDRPHGLDAVLVVPPATDIRREGGEAEAESVWESTAARAALECGAPDDAARPAVACVSVSVTRPTDRESPVARRFRVTRIVGGRKRVTETDSPAEYLRCLVDEMAGDFNLTCCVRVTEFPGGWLLVDVRHEGEANRAASLRFAEFAHELSHVFKTFYETAAESRDGRSHTWRVRHIHDCPWI